MKYHPKPGAQEAALLDDTLLDVDALVAADARLPDALPETPGPSPFKKVGAAGAEAALKFDPRASQAEGGLPVLLGLGLGGFALFSLLAWLLPEQPFYPLIAVFALAGLVASLFLTWKTFDGRADRAYIRTYLFFALSAGAALFGYLPGQVLGLVLAPFLFGYGAGSYLAVFLRIVVSPAATENPA